MPALSDYFPVPPVRPSLDIEAGLREFAHLAHAAQVELVQALADRGEVFTRGPAVRARFHAFHAAGKVRLPLSH